MKKLSIFALIISVIAIAISLFTIRHQSIGQADYIAIAATLLTGAVAFAVGYNIYINLSVTKSIAKEVAEEKAKTVVDEYIRINDDRMANYVAGSGNYALGATHYKIGEYKQALNFLYVAKFNFEAATHPDMVAKCDEFLVEINRRIQEQGT